VAFDDPNGLYNTSMAINGNIAGIARIGSPGAYAYAVTGPFGTTPAGANSPGNRPITFVSWSNSARFANWMSNGQPTGAQGPTTTENGAYNLNNVTSGVAPVFNETNPNTGAVPLYRIPTEDQWYKAAYYKGGSTNAGYWDYATQSDTAPGNTIGSGANQANYFAGGYSVTRSVSYSSSQNYLTDVGAFTNSQSAYGTFDQTGNVFEWNDLTGAADSSRGHRGGAWDYVGFQLSSDRSSASLSHTQATLGFRLASPVPEPSTWVMGLAGIACAAWGLRRKRSLTGERPPSTSRA
jgi:sulfatase modifying factor 1